MVMSARVHANSPTLFVVVSNYCPYNSRILLALHAVPLSTHNEVPNGTHDIAWDSMRMGCCMHFLKNEIIPWSSFDKI